MNNIRIMQAEDLPAIDEIYNQAIEAKFSTAHTIPLTGEARELWFREHDPASYPVYVFETTDPGEKDLPDAKPSRIAGWFSFSPYRKGRKALERTAEISYFVHQDFHRRGIATTLMKHAILTAPSLKYRTLIAILMEPNTSSIALLKKFGFDLWGNMPGILEVDGGNYDHQYWGLHLE